MSLGLHIAAVGFYAFFAGFQSVLAFEAADRGRAWLTLACAFIACLYLGVATALGVTA